MTSTKHHHILLLASFLLPLLVSSCSTPEPPETPHVVPEAEEDAGFYLVRDCIARAGIPGILNVVPVGEPTVRHLEDFSDVLNGETCDFYENLKDDAFFGYRTECEEIRLAGVDDPMLFVQTRQGSFGGTSVYILRRDLKSGKWRNLHGGPEEGSLSDISALPVTVNGITRFLEPDIDYGPKLLRGFRVFDYDPDADKFVKVASASIRHSFATNDEDTKWIRKKDLEEMAFGDGAAPSDKFVYQWGSRTLQERRFLSSSAGSTDGYYLHIEESGRTVWPLRDGGREDEAFVGGFLPVTRDGTNALVFLENERTDVDDYRLSVLDVDSLQIVYTHVLLDQKTLCPKESGKE